uniref:Uncharacterized protein n=1 Tax=Globodera rostochiensis TaxID=31243 RepID=A0A914HB08_GLORO
MEDVVCPSGEGEEETMSGEATHSSLSHTTVTDQSFDPKDASVADFVHLDAKEKRRRPPRPPTCGDCWGQGHQKGQEFAHVQEEEENPVFCRKKSDFFLFVIVIGKPGTAAKEAPEEKGDALKAARTGRRGISRRSDRNFEEISLEKRGDRSINTFLPRSKTFTYFCPLAPPLKKGL